MRTTPRPAPLAGIAGVLLGVTALGVSFAAPASAEGNGNNGTVKVDELDLDNGPGDEPGNDNDPHIDDCAGQIEWYGFDEGAQSATATFEVWAPAVNTAEAETTLVLTTDDIEGDGPGVPNEDADLDGQLPFDLHDLLEPYTPQEQQGFHVKLTVETTLSESQSDVKHKVFWIDACDPAEEPEPQPEPEAQPEPVVPPVVVTTTTTALPAEVLGVQQTRALPRTGSSDGQLLALATGLILVGTGTVLGSRRRPATVPTR